jgi:hypothetical protein
MAFSATTIEAFDLAPAPKTGLRLFVRGEPRYADLLRRAFPAPASWFGPYESYSSDFDYVLYAQQADETALRRFARLATEALFVTTPCDECWALSFHMTAQGRTSMGELVFKAKAYSNKGGDPEAAEQLAGRFAESFSVHPGVARCDVVTSVPANPPKEGIDLPGVLGDALATRIGRPFEPGLITKIRPTPQIKNLPNDQKAEALMGAFEPTSPMDLRRIVVVDDILRSGTTLGHMAAVAREAGAADVIGLVATKTARD